MAYNRVIRKRIGELLVERGVITQEQLEKALELQKEKGGLLGEILVEHGMATEDQVITCIANQYGLPFLPLENYNISHEVIELVSHEVVYKYNIIPIDKIGDILTVACIDVFDDETIEEIEKTVGSKIQCFLTTPSALKKAIFIYYLKNTP